MQLPIHIRISFDVTNQLYIPRANMNWKSYIPRGWYMASNVINRWFINYKPWIILEATTLDIMYLVPT